MLLPPSFKCDNCGKTTYASLTWWSSVEPPKGWTIWCPEEPLHGIHPSKHFCEECGTPCECEEHHAYNKSPFKWERKDISSNWISLISGCCRWRLSIPRYGPAKVTLFDDLVGVAKHGFGEDTASKSDLWRIKVCCGWADSFIPLLLSSEAVDDR